MRATKTFREILETTADANSRRVVERAHTASRIAKCASDMGSRRLAYGVKHAALAHGLERFPDRFELSGLELDGRLARIRYRDEACFHLPVSACGAPARAWMDAERARIATTWALVGKAA
jgi:hypothetical protein